MTSVIIIGAIVAILLVMNLVPQIREWTKGRSTLIETAVGTVLYAFGQFAEAIEEAQAAGYLPENFTYYAGFLLIAWIIIKRFQTTTPVGVTAAGAVEAAEEAEAKAEAEEKKK